ncbi:amidohydrolase family protein [Streptomyces virginiae]|uniref:amidohydrolase family protein n=1 Tax=Streptomyces virginiae TaxID=1961 RepID=UPI0032486CB1
MDTHIHYVQTGIIAAFGSQLIDWPNHYSFVEAQRFSDPAYAWQVAESFCDELLPNGTTTALTSCAVYPESVDALFKAASARNMRMTAGEVLMDRNAPDALLDTAQSVTRTPRCRWNAGTARDATSTPPHHDSRCDDPHPTHG